MFQTFRMELELNVYDMNDSNNLYFEVGGGHYRQDREFSPIFLELRELSD